MTARTPHNSARRRAFTLIELLVVVGVIVTLLAIGLTAGNAALTSAKRSATERLLQTVSQGLDQFKADHGYYPPLLNPDPAGTELGALVSESLPDAFSGSSQDPVLRANYRSDLSLTAYLIGVGDLNEDDREEYAANQPNLDDGVNGPGLRAPGPDKSWGGARERAQGPQTQASDPPLPPQDGRVYGPYVNLANTKALKRLAVADETADSLHHLENMFVIVDRWGNEIRYYRHLPTGTANLPSLDAVPAELLQADAAKQFSGSGQSVPPSVDAALLDAEYVLVSAGPDGYYGDRESETTNVDPQTPRYLTAAGNSGIGQNGPLGAEPRSRILRRISDNLRVMP